MKDLRLYYLHGEDLFTVPPKGRHFHSSLESAESLISTLKKEFYYKKCSICYYGA